MSRCHFPVFHSGDAWWPLRHRPLGGFGLSFRFRLIRQSSSFLVRLKCVPASRLCALQHEWAPLSPSVCADQLQTWCRAKKMIVFFLLHGEHGDVLPLVIHLSNYKKLNYCQLRTLKKQRNVSIMWLDDGTKKQWSDSASTFPLLLLFCGQKCSSVAKLEANLHEIQHDYLNNFRCVTFWRASTAASSVWTVCSFASSSWKLPWLPVCQLAAPNSWTLFTGYIGLFVIYFFSSLPVMGSKQILMYSAASSSGRDAKPSTTRHF